VHTLFGSFLHPAPLPSAVPGRSCSALITDFVKKGHKHNKRDKAFLLGELRIGIQRDSYYCSHVPMCYDPCWLKQFFNYAFLSHIPRKNKGDGVIQACIYVPRQVYYLGGETKSASKQNPAIVFFFFYLYVHTMFGSFLSPSPLPPPLPAPPAIVFETLYIQQILALDWSNIFTCLCIHTHWSYFQSFKKVFKIWKSLLWHFSY
jgi:hypothetical protein